MADSRKAFFQRVISALLAIALATATGYYGGRAGLYVLTTIAIVLGVREYSRMAFLHWRMPTSIHILYWMVSILFYGLMISHSALGLTWFAASNALFFTAAIWLTRNKVINDDLLPALAVGTFGMLYGVLFPYFALELIQLDEGPQWFVFLLLVVFAGDTFAYFGGRFWGREKLMPQISPNKTWAGMYSGLMGTLVAGCSYLHFALPHVPLSKTVVFCLLCGFAAQTGDLLMSLVKRVAQVKDSGHIMPGHGGVLDRLDGIFIACPLVYAFAIMVS